MTSTRTMDRVLFVAKACVFVVILLGGCVFSEAADDASQTNNSVSDTAPSGDPKGEVNETPLEKGTKPLFFVTNFFLNQIVQPNVDGIPINIPQFVKNGTIDLMGVLNVAQNDWQKYTLHYLGFLICFALGIIFMIVMPIVGLCFCCCRLCGRCGAKPDPMDSKHAKYKRVCFGTFLFIVTTFMLAATVCAFVTNDLIHTQATDRENGFIGSVDKNIKDVEKYINKTSKEVKDAFLKRFDETKNDIIQDVRTISDKVQTDIGNLTNAGPLLDDATKLAQDVTNLRQDLQTTKNKIQELKTAGQSLKTKLQTVKNDINSALSGCSAPECNLIKTQSSQLALNIDFAQLANVDDVITKLEAVEAKDIKGLIKQGRDDYNEISANISSSVKQYIKDAETGIEKTRADIEREITALTTELTKSIKTIRDARGQVTKLQPQVEEVGNYVMYAGIGLSCVLLLVVLLNYLGLMFGACGERPYEDARACNKGVGANFLMAGVGITFLFCWLLMLLTTILFLVGGTTETEICRHLVDPINSKQIEQIDKLLDLGKYVYGKPNTDLSIQQVLSECKNNSAIYSALRLENLVNATKMVDDAMKTVDVEVEKVANEIKKVKIDKVTLLSADTKKQLDKVTNSDYNTLNFQKSLDELKKSILKLQDLGNYISALEAVKDKPGVKKAELQTSIDALKTVNTQDLPKMQTDIDALKTLMQKLDAAKITTSASNLKKGLEDAETNINQNSTKLIQEAAKSTEAKLKARARVFGDQLLSELENNIGRCSDLYNALMGLINASCKKTLNPFNGFWFAFGWCLFFFIPSLIFAVKLAGLYRKTEKYSAKEFDDGLSTQIEYVPGQRGRSIFDRNLRKVSPQPNAVQNISRFSGLSNSYNLPTIDPVRPEDRRNWAKRTRRHEKKAAAQKNVFRKLSSDTNNYHGIYPGDNIPLNEMRNNPKHYRDGRGLQNTGYEQDRAGTSRGGQRNGAPAHNSEHRGGYGDGGSPRDGQGYPDDYHPHSRPPAYAAPTPPHWQNNRYHGHRGGHGY